MDNDVWRYGLDTRLWDALDPAGAVPSVRAFAGYFYPLT